MTNPPRTMNRHNAWTRQQTGQLIAEDLLRAMLVVPILLGMSCSTVDAAETSAAKSKVTLLEEKIRATGGRVRRNDYKPGKPIHEIAWMGPQVGDAEMKLLTALRLTDLENCFFTKASITGDGLRHLAGATNLVMLKLSETKIDNDALQHLRGMVHLHELRLYTTNISDQGLEHLKSLKSLRLLQLGVPHCRIAASRVLRSPPTLWVR